MKGPYMDDIKLFEDFLKSEEPPTMRDRLLTLLTEVYTSGYKSGHHDTVEANYTDVFHQDRKTYFLDNVTELVTIDDPEKTSEFEAILNNNGDCTPLKDTLDEVIACLEAAEYDGLIERIRINDVDAAIDIYTRRVLYALELARDCKNSSKS